jgi:hypothetical protein
MITWGRIREGRVCARPHRNSGILFLEEKTKRKRKILVVVVGV